MYAYQLKPLKGKENFSFIYNNGIRYYENSSLALFRTMGPTEPEPVPDEPHTIYCGVVIGKRTSRKAVVRNRVRRLMRVSIKQSLKELEGTYKFNLIDSMIFIWRKDPSRPMKISLNQVKSEIKSILQCFISDQYSKLRENAD